MDPDLVGSPQSVEDDVPHVAVDAHVVLEKRVQRERRLLGRVADLHHAPDARLELHEREDGVLLLGAVGPLDHGYGPPGAGCDADDSLEFLALAGVLLADLFGRLFPIPVRVVPGWKHQRLQRLAVGHSRGVEERQQRLGGCVLLRLELRPDVLLQQGGDLLALLGSTRQVDRPFTVRESRVALGKRIGAGV